ncbi:MAG: hypothetical protein ACRCZF_00090 [Gemmataceae bacterium]
MAETAVESGRRATNAEAYVIGGAGVLLAWAVLVICAAAGYGTTVALAGPVTPLPLGRLVGSGSAAVVVLFGIAGFLIESLRFQGPSRSGRNFRAWAAARRLRLGLFAVLAMTAVGVGVFAAVWWTDAAPGSASVDWA